MMSEYIDGVPVKISEKYKPPKRIELPTGVPETISRAQKLLENVNYDLSFEENVLVKLEELKKAKATAENERKHRLQLYEEAKQQKIHEKEAQEKLKLLNVSEVSYPSTEEISNYKTNNEYKLPIENTIDHSNLLQPVQIKALNPPNLIDDPDPLKEIKINRIISRIKVSNVDNLTVQDFENDTSSPFDNMELKTINDMDILAEVLHSNTHNGVLSTQNYDNYDNYYNEIRTPYPGYDSNNYYASNCDINSYNQNYYPTSSVYNSQSVVNYYDNSYEVYTNCEVPEPALPVKNRVNEILTELEREIALNRERHLNSLSYFEENSSVASSSKTPEKPPNPSSKEVLPNPYQELTADSKVLCDYISSMGFPLDRVARVCQLIGTNDDKKIVDGLIDVDKLMDLGFTECQVTSALWRHQFNKDNALDELVS